MSSLNRPGLRRCLLLVACAVGMGLAQPAAARNLLANSSFELGPDHRYAIGRWFMNGLPNTRLDETTKVHGRASLRLPFSVRGYAPDGPHGMELRSGVAVSLEKGKTYTFSIFLKTDVPDATASLEISPAPPYEHRGSPVARTKITLGRRTTPQGFEYPWSRHSLTFKAEKAEDVYWVVKVDSRRPGTLWADAVQFEEGPLGDYHPVLPAEVGLFDTAIGHIHDPGAAPEMELRAFNDGAAPARQRIRLRVLEDTGTVVSERMLSLAIPAKSRTKERIRLDTKGAHGIFVVELTLPDGPRDYLQDTSFTVLPPPRPVVPAQSAFGAYITPSEEALPIFARAGFHWTSTLTSAEPMANWSLVERSKGRYAWRDADVELFRRYGFEVMLNLEGWAYPKWADTLTIPEKTSAFARYVEAATRHFRGKVRYFNFTDEIHNKVPGSHMLGRRKATWNSPQEYAAWHTAVHAAAKRGNPDAQVVLNTDVGAYGADHLFRYMSPKTVDVLAGNYYPYPDAVRSLKRSAAGAGIRSVWAPGVGINTWPMYFRKYRPPGPDSGRYLDDIARRLIRSFANGAQVFFHYTGSYVGNTNVYSVIEHDSSLETSGAQFAALAWLLDGFTAARAVPVVRASRIEAYRFDRRDGTTVFAVWSKLRNAVQNLTFERPVEGVRVYDRWTTEKPGREGFTALPLSEGTRFLMLPTAQADAFERRLSFARFKIGALPPSGDVLRAGPYALVRQAADKAKRRDGQIVLWYDAGEAGWVELFRRGTGAGGPAAALDPDGLTLRFRYAWDGRARHMEVGNLPSDLFWGARFWRSMPDRGKPAWQTGEIADRNLHGRVIEAKAGAPPPLSGLAPVAYAIQGTNGLTLALETSGEQPNPRFPQPGGWDIYVWRADGPDRTIGIWRYVHAGAARDRDLSVRVRVMPAR